jgi:putative effector of murein hydrolase
LRQKYQYISAACAVITQVEAMFIGLVGSFLANITSNLLIHIRVDDAVGATCVHGMFSHKRGLKTKLETRHNRDTCIHKIETRHKGDIIEI